MKGPVGSMTRPISSAFAKDWIHRFIAEPKPHGCA